MDFPDTKTLVLLGIIGVFVVTTIIFIYLYFTNKSKTTNTDCPKSICPRVCPGDGSCNNDSCNCPQTQAQPVFKLGNNGMSCDDYCTNNGGNWGPKYTKAVLAFDEKNNKSLATNFARGSDEEGTQVLCICSN
jgi:hypothetical protein